MVNLYKICDVNLLGKNPEKKPDTTVAWNVEDDVLKCMLAASEIFPSLLCLLEIQNE